MAISTAVQQALDGIRQTQSLVKSVEDGLAVQKQMIADLQAQIAAGATIGPDDLAALAETNTDIADVNASLTKDIPANTSTGTSAPQTAKPAPDAPAPLAGTGTT